MVESPTAPVETPSRVLGILALLADLFLVNRCADPAVPGLLLAPLAVSGYTIHVTDWDAHP